MNSSEFEKSIQRILLTVETERMKEQELIRHKDETRYEQERAALKKRMAYWKIEPDSYHRAYLMAPYNLGRKVPRPFAKFGNLEIFMGDPGANQRLSIRRRVMIEGDEVSFWKSLTDNDVSWPDSTTKMRAVLGEDPYRWWLIQRTADMLQGEIDERIARIRRSSEA